MTKITRWFGAVLVLARSFIQVQNLIPFIKPALLLFWYHCYIVCNTGINIGIFFSLNILTKYPDFDSHSFPNSTTCIVGVNAIYFEKWIIYTAKKSEHRYYKNLFIQGMFLRIVSLILRLTSPIVYAFSFHGMYIDTDCNTRHLRATRQTIGTLNSGLYLCHQLFSCACLS